MNNLKKSIMSVAMAAITAASPILSSYVAYASDITVNDDGTVTQISTSTEGSTSKADETKFLFIKLKTAGGKVVLNEGEDQEQRIRLDKKMDGVEYIDVYDKNDVLISSESTKDNDYTYVYEAKADDAVNVKAKADEGYKVKLYELTDDSSGTEIAEDVGFDAGNKVDSFKYPVFMEYDKTVKIGFEKTESADDIAKDLSVNDEAGKDKADEQSKAEADAESEDKTGEKDEPKSEETEDLKSKDAKADEKTAAEVSNDKKSEDTEDSKTTEDADAPEKSEDLKDIDSNDKQNVSEEIAADNDLTVNTDDNKKDNEESDITVNDSSITKDIDENAGEEPNESSSEDIMDNNERSEDAKDADSDNSDKNFVSDETSDSADKDTTMNGSETEGTEKAEEAGSQTDNAEDKIENDKQDAEQSYDISNLDNTIFASARLVVISDDAKNVSADSKYIIANYQNIYLIQYETVEDAMKAYVKYTDAGLTTEPDAALSAASEIDLSDSDAEQIKEEIKEDAVESSTPEIKADEIQATAPVETTDIIVNENENPLSSLNEESQAAPVEVSSKLIALIDTGVPDGNPHVVDRVSLIDNNLGASDSHGDDMLQGIITENKNARVLSIRVMGDDGKCTVSSVIAGIEYAISQHADIINLSLYARTNIANSVLKAEIEKAVESGITVVAAAGNDGADVKDYMPGSVDAAIVVAACDEFGNISASSNYGKTVDYKVVASSTSEAAAKLTGHIAGISGDVYNLPPYIFKSDEYADATEEPSVDASEDETMEAAETTYSKVKTDLIRPLIDVFLPSDWINKNDVDMVARQYATHYDKSSKKLSETQSFCMEPYKCSANYGDHTGHTKRMDTGTSYKDTTITKALYYLYGGPAFEDNAQSLSGKTVNFKDLIKSYGCSTGNEYYCTTHYVVSWIWNGGSGSTAPKSGWASGVTSKGIKNLKAIVKALEDMPMPASEAKFNKSSVTATYDATTQKRKTAKVTYKASRENKLTFTLPKGIKVIDAADGKEKTTIYGGTTFYFVVDDSKPKGSATIKATTRYPVEFRAYRTTDSGEDTQELTFSYQPTYNDLKIKLSWDGVPGDRWKIQAKLKKINENGEGLSGAVFRVYDTEACDEDYIGTLETTANGESNILKLDEIPADEKSYTIYCKEVKAPDGYAVQDTIYPLTFEKTEFDKLYKADPNTDGELKTFGPDEGISNPSVTPPVTPPITPPTGGLYIKKTSKAPDDIMNLKSYTLEGAEYKVTSSRDASFNATLTTNQGGYTNTVTLPDNSIPRHSDAVVDMKGNVLIPAKDWIEKVQTTYYIVETKAPNYHSVYKGSKTQSVTMPDDAGQTFEIPFVNEPLFCDDSLDIEKLGVKGEPVVGAVFKVQYFDANSANESDLVRTWYLKSDESGHVRMDNNHLDTNNRSDDFFKYDGNIVIPIGGYLQITEIDAPAEYVVETEPVGIATTKDADFTLTYANQMKPWYEEYERCRINIKKYEPDGSTPIAGVEFELKFVKQAITPTNKMHPNFKRLLKEGETTVRHTDANGEVFFDNLDQGEYEITEIKTKPGMGLMKEKIKVTLPFTMTFNEALKYKNVKFSTAKEDINYTGKWYFYECTYEITNNQLFGMPMTGDDGRWKYGFIGFAGFSIISCGFILHNKSNKKKKRRQNK